MQRYYLRDTSVPDNRGGKVHVFDRLRNGTPIAVCEDVDMAQRIVDLLNAYELTKAGGTRRYKELNA